MLDTPDRALAAAKACQARSSTGSSLEKVTTLACSTECDAGTALEVLDGVQGGGVEVGRHPGERHPVLHERQGEPHTLRRDPPRRRRRVVELLDQCVIAVVGRDGECCQCGGRLR